MPSFEFSKAPYLTNPFDWQFYVQATVRDGRWRGEVLVTSGASARNYRIVCPEHGDSETAARRHAKSLARRWCEKLEAVPGARRLAHEQDLRSASCAGCAEP